MSKMSAQQIYQYLSSKGLQLTSDKVFKQPEKHADTIWSVYAFLTNQMKNEDMQNIQSLVIYNLQNTKHQQSSKWVKQHIIISDIFRRLGLPYKIIEMIKPQKQKVLANISKLIQLKKHRQKVLKKYDTQFNKWRLNKQSLVEAIKKRDFVQHNFELIKKKKSQDRTLYIEKENSLKLITGQLKQKINEKNTLLENQKLLEDQIEKLEKKKAQQSLEIQRQNYEQIRLKKQLVQNLPELQSRRYQVESQLAKVQKETVTTQNNVKNKIKIQKQQNTTSKKILKSIQQKLKNLEKLYNICKNSQQQLQIMKSQQAKLQQQLKRVENQLNQLFKNIKQKNKDILQITQNLYNLKKELEAKESIWSSLNNQIKKVSQQCTQNQQLVSKIITIRQSLKLKLISVKNDYERNRQLIQQQYNQIKQTTNHIINNLYSPFK